MPKAGVTTRLTLADPLKPAIIDELGDGLRKELQVAAADPAQIQHRSHQVLHCPISSTGVQVTFLSAWLNRLDQDSGCIDSNNACINSINGRMVKPCKDPASNLQL